MLVHPVLKQGTVHTIWSIIPYPRDENRHHSSIHFTPQATKTATARCIVLYIAASSSSRENRAGTSISTTEVCGIPHQVVSPHYPFPLVFLIDDKYTNEKYFGTTHEVCRHRCIKPQTLLTMVPVPATPIALVCP